MRAVWVLLSIAGIAAPLAARGGSVIAAGGQWAAVLRGDRCDAESRILVATSKGRAEAIAGFAFKAGGRPWGQFHVRLSRQPRIGSSVIATVGGQSHLLVVRGREAWSRDARQDQALVLAVRSADILRVEARDASGRRFSDRYGLTFAPTAIDAAAARCASLRST